MGIFITEVKKHFHLTQGSALHSMLFMLFINDLETRISSKVAKFAYDTKLFRVVKSRKKLKSSRRISKLEERTTVLCKCKVMHIKAKVVKILD